jgi:hypothetical protein
LQQAQKRRPAIERKINEISENDRRVRILGIVVSTAENLVVMDDGTGLIPVRVEETLREKGKYRIIGQVNKVAENKLEIVAEIVQDMRNLDMELYQKVIKIKRKFKSSN